MTFLLNVRCALVAIYPGDLPDAANDPLIPPDEAA